MFVHLPVPYGISYRAIVPRPCECQTCSYRSAPPPHMQPDGSYAWNRSSWCSGNPRRDGSMPRDGSRELPAGHPYPDLRKQLLAYGQILDWNPPLSRLNPHTDRRVERSSWQLLS